MKKLVFLVYILSITDLVAADKATSVCIEAGICVPAATKQVIVDHCKNVLNQSRGTLPIALGSTDYTVRNVTLTQIKDAWVEGSFYSVDLSTSSIGAGTVSLLCVYDTADKLIRIGKPVSETEANLAIYRNALKFVE